MMSASQITIGSLNDGLSIEMARLAGGLAHREDGAATAAGSGGLAGCFAAETRAITGGGRFAQTSVAADVHFCRRDFLRMSAMGMASSAISNRMAIAASRRKIRAIAFDALAIFDTGSVSALAEKLYPGRGAGLSQAWKMRQFEYTWLRTVSHTYVDFWHITEDALLFAAEFLNLSLSPENRRQLMNAYLELRPWSEAVPALRSLRSFGLRLAILSNFTVPMLRACIRDSGLSGLFEHILSADQVMAFKPDTRSYQLGTDAFSLDREDVLFVASAGWDAAGAKRFGYPTFWVNRPHLPAERLGIGPDASGNDLDYLLGFLVA